MAVVGELSSWRKFRKCRISTRPIGIPRKREKLNMFFGYSRPSLDPKETVATGRF